MDELMNTVDQIIAILDRFESPIQMALVVLLYMLNRNVKANTVVNSPTLSAQAEQKAAAKQEKAEAKTLEKARSERKKVLESEMKAALDVYFSDKTYADMTSEEQALYNKAAAYLGGA